jgi:hypothetical protein
VFILLEAADLPKKLRVVLKNPERSLSTIEKFSQSAKRYLVIKTLISLPQSSVALNEVLRPFPAFFTAK